MTHRPTIDQQRKAVEEMMALALAGGVHPTDELMSKFKCAVLTLAWIERRAELVREMDRLDRDAPEILSLLKEFPGAQIAEVR